MVYGVNTIRPRDNPQPTPSQPFVFQDVPPGLKTVRVEVSDFDPVERDIDVRQNQDIPLVFTFTRKESERMRERVEEKMKREGPPATHDTRIATGRRIAHLLPGEKGARIGKFRKKFEEEGNKILARTDISKEVKRKLLRDLHDELKEKEFTKEERDWMDKERKERQGKREKTAKYIGEEKRKKYEKAPYNYLFRGKVSEHVMKVIGTVAIIGLGVLLSAMFGSTLFMWAFIAWGAMVMVPNPDEEKEFKLSGADMQRFLKRSGGGAVSQIANIGIMASILVSNRRHPRVGFGLLRTLFKLTAIGFGIYGIYASELIPFKPLVLLIACFITYYSLKITYKPNMPHHFLESVLRFGFLGAWMIPWIFFEYFQSSVLALIALAFLAIPPIAETEKASEADTSSVLDMTLRIGFGVIMILVLIGSGSLPFGISAALPGFKLTWGLTGALKDAFLYFWFISLIAGGFSSTQTRPAMGFIMIIASTVIFGLGPGQQEVGTALFGQWYPVVQNFMSAVGQPFGELFGTLGSTFGSTWMMLTNPIGYAQQIMNGTYVRDPATGIAGAFGIELESIHATNIYNEQPFLLMMTLKNKGAYDAKKVSVIVQPNARYETGVPAPREETSSDWTAWDLIPGVGAAELGAGMVHRSFIDKKETISMEEFGFKTQEGQNCDINVVGIPACEYKTGDMPKLDVEQAAFSSTGIMCQPIVKYALMTKEKAKVLPFNIQLSYDYRIDSTMGMEFMSNSEWDRLAQQGLLVNQAKKASQFKNAPVRLNIDTLEQPIREGVAYHLAFNLISAQPNSQISSVDVEIRYPVALDPDCKASCRTSKVAEPFTPNNSDGKNCVIERSWEAPYVMFCSFPGFHGAGSGAVEDKGGSASAMTKPTESFAVTANATYTFNRFQSYDTRIQFGGEPCCDADANNIGNFPCPLSAQSCENNKCVAAAAEPPSAGETEGGTPGSGATEEGSPGSGQGEEGVPGSGETEASSSGQV